MQHRVGLLESMLGLYQKKYQASLGRAGQLESQRQQLAEELATQVRPREGGGEGGGGGRPWPPQAELPWSLAQARERDEGAFETQEELQRRCRQLARAEDTIARLVQELRGAQEELAQGQQYEETIQALQKQLSASHAKVLAEGARGRAGAGQDGGWGGGLSTWEKGTDAHALPVPRSRGGPGSRTQGLCRLQGISHLLQQHL